MNSGRSKSKLRSHKPSRIAAFASVAVVVVAVLFFLFHSEKTILTIPADLDRDTIDLTLKAYSAEKLAEPLYTYDATARVSDGKLSFAWQIPDEYAQRDALIELAMRENLNQDESYHNSCAYFVPAHSRGTVPDLFGWNDLTESQQIGCLSEEDDAVADKYSSYIAMMSDVQNSLNEFAENDGIAVYNADNSDISVTEIRDIVNEILQTGSYSVAGPTVIGATGPQGLTGAAGAQGKDGTNGANGTDGVVSVTGGGLALNNHILSLQTCAEGQILKVTAGAWACANDNNSGMGGGSTYSTGDGLKLSGANVFSIDAPICTAGQYLTWDGINFSCVTDQNTPDTDTDTIYGAKANGGLTLDGNNDFSLMTCTDTQILKWNGATTRWECAADENTTYDLSGYLQVANLQTAIDGLTPGYYTKTEVDNLLNTFAGTVPVGGLKIPQQVANESSLSVASCTEAGDYFYIQDMDVTALGHTGRAWCYEDSTGAMQLYKVFDNYLSSNNSSIITSGGLLSVSTTWLDTYLTGKNYATQTDLTNAIAAIDFTPYVKHTDIPTCSAGYVLTSTTAGVFSCVAAATVDNDTLYQAGNGLQLNVVGANNIFSINAPTCAAGEYLTWNGASFTCAADQNTPDTNTTYSAKTGGGLVLDGSTNEFSLTTCADGQILTYSGTITNWQCANLPSGGSLPNGTAAGEMLYWDGTTWQFTGTGGSQTLDNVTADSLLVNNNTFISGTLTLAGGIVDSVGSTGNSGQMLAVDASGNLVWQDACQGGLKQIDPPITFGYTATTLSGALDLTFAEGILHGYRIYMFGGDNSSSSAINTARYYDTKTGIFTAVANFPRGDRNIDGASDGTNIYIFGGGVTNNVSDDAYRYDPVANTYTAIAPLPQPRRMHDVQYYNGKFYILGGYNSTTNATSAYVYDPTTNTYATYPLSLPGNAGVTLVGSDLYMVGSGTYSGGGSTSSVYKVNLDTMTVTTLASLPNSTVSPAVMSVSGKIISIGGSSTTSVAPDRGVFTYDIATDTWSPTTISGVINKTQAVHVQIGSSLYVMGGRSGSGTSIQRIDYVGVYPLAYLKAGDRAMINVSYHADQDVQDAATGTTITAGTIIPAGTEISVLTDGTHVYLDSDLTSTGSWLFIDNTCGASGGSGLSSGTTAGEMLYWDGTNWVLTGTGGNQTLDFVSATSVTAANLKATYGLDLTAATGGLKDFYGNTGATGDRLTIDNLGNLRWMPDTTCQTTVQPTNLIEFKTESTTTPVPIRESGNVTIGQYFYSFGGYTTAYANNSYRYDLADGGQAVPIANYPIANANPATVTDGTYIYLFGVQSTSMSTNAYRYDPAADTYVALANLPAAAGSPIAQYYNGKVYIFGGMQTNMVFSRNLYIYDIASNTYTTMANFLPVGVARLKLQSVGNTIYLLGGANSSNVGLSSTYSVDLSAATPTLTTLASMPAGRYGGAVTYQDGKIYYINGSSSSYNLTNLAFAYDVASDTWTAVSIAGAVVGTLSNTATYNNVLWTFGGFNGPTANTSTNAIRTYTFNINHPFVTLDTDDRYVIPADTTASQDVNDYLNNAVITAGTIIPAHTEVEILTNGTDIYIKADIPDNSGWIRRAVYCSGGGSTNLPSGTRTGQALVWNGTDWAAGEAISIDSATTTALNIKDGASNTIFNIDTMSGIVSIGNGATTDSTAVALLLDSSTVAPANPQNGMMYYDTTLAKFRCYENGAWKNCITESTPFRDNIIVGGMAAGYSATTANTWLPFDLSATQGDMSLLSGNTVTIPEDGYYLVSLTVGGTTAGGSEARYTGIYINGATLTGISLLQTTKDTPDSTVAIYLNEGDTVQFQYNQPTFPALTQQPQWSIIRQGNSNLIDRPDLWTAGVEYDFSDGLYGVRATGAITAAVNAQTSTTLYTVPGGITNLVSSGGFWTADGNIRKSLVGGYARNNFGSMIDYRPDNESFVLRSVYDAARTNAPYDIWIKYTK